MPNAMNRWKGLPKYRNYADRPWLPSPLPPPGLSGRIRRNPNAPVLPPFGGETDPSVPQPPQANLDMPTIGGVGGGWPSRPGDGGTPPPLPPRRPPNLWPDSGQDIGWLPHEGPFPFNPVEAGGDIPKPPQDNLGGASMTIAPSFYQNLSSLWQTPAAAPSAVEALADALNPTGAPSNEVEDPLAGDYPTDFFPGIGGVGGNADDQYGIQPVLPPVTEPTTGGGWDFWTAIGNILGSDYDISALQGLMGQVGNRWRIPKKAQEMLTFAEALKGFGPEGEDIANQMVMQAIMQGWNRPTLDLASLFAPAFQGWFGR